MNTQKTFAILNFCLALFLGLIASNVVFATAPTIYLSPEGADKQIGDSFEIAVRINTDGEKICVVRGEVVLSLLDCQNVQTGELISYPVISCNNPKFILSAPHCFTGDKLLFTLILTPNSSGSAKISFADVLAVGNAGATIPVSYSEGNYNISAPCTCGDWGDWQTNSCGEGSCGQSQRQQTKVRTCSPAGCDLETEKQCIEDENCSVLPSGNQGQNQAVEELEEPKELTGESSNSAPSEKIFSEPSPFVPTLPKDKGLAAMSVLVFKEIYGSTSKIIIMILSLAVLALLVIREIFKSRKKNKKVS